MKNKILSLLRSGEEYISGQQICEQLGVSRTAVWKAVNSLKADGYEIEAVQNRGYHLVSAPDVLSETEIRLHRTDKWRDCPMAVFDTTDSTNNQVKRLMDEGAPEGTLCVADVQTAGKGRRGRRWETPAGIAIAMSFGLRPKFDPSRASMITLLAALASCRAVEELTGRTPQIKWPNDLVMNKKKLNGILTEMILEADYIQQIIVGIGFNVHHEPAHFPEELQEKATSLWMECGEHYSRAELVALVMKHFTGYYEQFEREQSLAFIREEYNSLLVSCGQEVRILTPWEEWTGISEGINETGGLMVRTADGECKEVTAGEVSVRGIYGYV